MIDKVTFKNFKLLRDCEFPLGSLNVIVGANGVGKTSVLEGLSLLSAAISMLGARASRSLLPSGSGAAACVFKDAKGFDVGISTSSGHSVRLRTTITESTLASVLRYEGPLGNEEQSDATVFLTGGSLLEKVRKAELLGGALLQLEALRLREPHYSPERDLRMAFDGVGLASVLQRLQIARDGRFEAVEEEVARVVPFAKRIRTTQEPIAVVEQVAVKIEGEGTFVPHRREYVGAGFEVEWGDVGWVSSRQLSEGTLLVIGLATLLWSSPPSLVLVDDVDKALHPTAQIEVVRMLQRFLAQNPSVQILATTHSPFVVDALAPEQVLVAGCVDARTTTIRSLSKHPSWAKQKNYLEPGEFWSAVGESWVAEPRQ